MSAITQLLLLSENQLAGELKKELQMEPGVLDKICDQIYRRYPEFKGKKPKVKAYSGTQKLLIFSSQGQGADGKAITRSLRVIVDENGKIGKVSTSR